MKAKKLKQENENKAKELRERIKEIGVVKSAKTSGLLQPDISAWINGKRNWSYNKILKIAAKLEL